MIRVMKLHHVSLASKDLEASKAFFSGVLGLQEVARPGFGFRGAWYAVGDRQLHLIEAREGEAGAGQRLGRSDHLALEVTDVDEVRRTLEQHGIAYQEGGNHNLGMDQVFCRDPDGHVIEFARYT